VARYANRGSGMTATSTRQRSAPMCIRVALRSPRPLTACTSRESGASSPLCQTPPSSVALDVQPRLASRNVTRDPEQVKPEAFLPVCASCYDRTDRREERCGPCGQTGVINLRGGDGVPDLCRRWTGTHSVDESAGEPCQEQNAVCIALRAVRRCA
jgi:hypothetical protein